MRGVYVNDIKLQEYIFYFSEDIDNLIDCIRERDWETAKRLCEYMVEVLDEYIINEQE